MSTPVWPQTPADAIALMEWRDMGTSDGIKKLRLMFRDPENPAHQGSAMACVDLQRMPGVGWEVIVGDDAITHSSLKSAKEHALERALERITEWGYLPRPNPEDNLNEELEP